MNKRDMCRWTSHDFSKTSACLQRLYIHKRAKRYNAMEYTYFPNLFFAILCVTVTCRQIWQLQHAFSSCREHTTMPALLLNFQVLRNG